MSDAERAFSALFGGALLAFGVRRRGAPAALVGGALLHRGITGHCYAYEALGVDSRAHRGGPAGTGDGPTVFSRSITVGRPMAELESFVRDRQHLSRILGDLAEVNESLEGYRFELRLPGVTGSEPGSRNLHELSFQFRAAPRDWGTEVTAELSLDVGRVGRALAQPLSFLPENALEHVLRRLKSLAETGEVPTIEKNPAARLSARRQSSRTLVGHH